MTAVTTARARVAATCLIALSLGTIGAGVADGRSKAKSEITLDAESGFFSGDVMSKRIKCAVKRPVVLYRVTEEDTIKKIKSTTTNSEGEWKVKSKKNKTGTFQVRAPKTSKCFGAVAQSTIGEDDDE